MNRRSFALQTTGLLVGMALYGKTALAQAYPSQPVKLVVPFPAGSATDNIARVLAKELQDELGQPFVIDNRPGAQGILGTEMIARSVPDGYAVLVAAVSFAAARSMFRKLPFDPVADFTPISRVATTPLALVVRSDFPTRTAQEFVAYAKANAAKLSAGYGSSSSQVCIAQFNALAGINVLAVPYKGIPLAINDVLGGVLQFTFADLGNAIAQVKGGKMRAMGVTSEKRSAIVPDWPALAETLPGFDIDAWIAILGPKGLPDAVSRRLHEATTRALAKADVQGKLAVQGFTPAIMGPADAAPFVRNEVQKWARLSKQAGIEPE